MRFKELLQKGNVRPYVLSARFGLEKESQRSTLDGNLAKTDHPAILGNRSYHPYIQTDFCETQMELITPVVDSVQELLRMLEAIHDVALRSMSKDEILWPLSIPPHLPEKDEEIIIAKLDQFEDVLYRRYLAKEYGKRKQTVSGIHFNFEYAAVLVEQLFSVQTECQSIEEFKTVIYMKVSRNYLRYRWLITYLFGASPVSEGGYFKEEEKRPEEPVRSIRNSSFGYTNHENVKVSYRSLERYIQDIHQMVETGILSEEKEFYAPVRLRGGKQMSDLPKTGIRYIELRNIDLNPFSRVGIDEETLRFLHIFMLYLLWADELKPADEWVAEGNKINEEVSLEKPFEIVSVQEEGEQLFTNMLKMLDTLNLTKEKALVLDFYQQLNQPEETIAGKMWTIIQENSNQELGKIYGREYQLIAWERPYQLAGYTNMELSTQILMFDAIQKGVSFEILDESEQFLKLEHNHQIEYVKNANMTSKDNYVVPLIMENKTVTKKVLAQAGFRVPRGEEFQTLEDAQYAYSKYQDKAFVVKPKTTNYGLGISIFKKGASFEDFSLALSLALAEDDSVLIEEFLEGTEYRFFVIDGQVQAILLRIPANVIGDGIHSVRALVEAKNGDSLRGAHHRAPLEKIQLTEVELLMLKEQNLTPDSIPEEGQQVFLRENSNISTGGDSIDVTDDFDESYKKIAVEAVEALGAKICGIDLIIPNKQIKAERNSTAYGIIEANFNPAMHMHIYPYKGKGRRLTKNVLNLLYPDLKIGKF